MLSLAYLYTWCLWSIIIWWHRRSRIKWNTLTTSSCHAYGMIPTNSGSLVAQYLADHRTNVLTYCLPSLNNMEEHNEVALEWSPKLSWDIVITAVSASSAHLTTATFSFTQKGKANDKSWYQYLCNESGGNLAGKEDLIRNIRKYRESTFSNQIIDYKLSFGGHYQDHLLKSKLLYRPQLINFRSLLKIYTVSVFEISNFGSLIRHQALTSISRSNFSSAVMVTNVYLHYLQR